MNTQNITTKISCVILSLSLILNASPIMAAEIYEDILPVEEEIIDSTSEVVTEDLVTASFYDVHGSQESLYALISGINDSDVTAVSYSGPSSSSSKSSSSSSSAETGIDKIKTASNLNIILTYASQMKEANNVATTTGGFTWDTERKTRSWTYYNGLMMDAYTMLGHEINLTYADGFYNANISSDGTISDFRTGELDSIEPMRAAFDLLDSSQYADKYKKAIQKVYTSLEGQTSYSECGGNYLHKMNSSTWSGSSSYNIALDGLYMAQPFLMECANAIDQEKITLKDKNSATVKSDDIYKGVYDRYVWIYDNFYDEATGLYNHGYCVASKSNNGICWSRAYGWYVMALVDVIEMMPEDTMEHISMKQTLISQLPRVFDGMLTYQNPISHMWVNIPADNSGNINNITETSGTSMICYALLKAYNNGYVSDDEYAIAGLNAFNGIVDNKVVNFVGKYTVQDIYKQSGCSSSLSSYYSSTYEADEAKGTGALIMCTSLVNPAVNKLSGNVDDPEPGNSTSASSSSSSDNKSSSSSSDKEHKTSTSIKSDYDNHVFELEVDEYALEYDGSKKTPAIDVFDSETGEALTLGVDYKISYKNNKNADAIYDSTKGFIYNPSLPESKYASYTIKFKGKYKTAKKITGYFMILPSDMDDVEVNLKFKDGIIIKAKLGKKVNFFKNAVNTKTNKKLSTTKDIEDKYLVPCDSNAKPTGEAEISYSNTYSAPSGYYLVNITGKGNYYGSTIDGMIKIERE